MLFHPCANACFFQLQFWGNVGVFTHPQSVRPLCLSSAVFGKGGCCFTHVQALASLSCGFWKVQVFLPIHKVCNPCFFHSQYLGKVGVQLRFGGNTGVFTRQPSVQPLPLLAAVWGKCGCFYPSTKCATLVFFSRSIWEGRVGDVLPIHTVWNLCPF